MADDVESVGGSIPVVDNQEELDQLRGITAAKRKFAFWCGGCVFMVGMLLTVILVPMSFAYVEPGHYGLRYNTQSRSTDFSKVYEAGRYFEGPSVTFETFPKSYQTLRVRTAARTKGTDDDGNVGVSIEAEVTIQYRLRKENIVELYRRHRRGYEPIYSRLVQKSLTEVIRQHPLHDWYRNRAEVMIGFAHDVAPKLAENYAELWCPGAESRVFEQCPGVQIADTRISQKQDEIIMASEMNRWHQRSLEANQIINASLMETSILRTRYEGERQRIANERSLAITRESQAGHDDAYRIRLQADADVSLIRKTASANKTEILTTAMAEVNQTMQAARAEADLLLKTAEADANNHTLTVIGRAQAVAMSLMEEAVADVTRLQLQSEAYETVALQQAQGFADSYNVSVVWSTVSETRALLKEAEARANKLTQESLAQAALLLESARANASRYEAVVVGRARAAADAVINNASFSRQLLVDRATARTLLWVQEAEALSLALRARADGDAENARQRVKFQTIKNLKDIVGLSEMGVARLEKTLNLHKIVAGLSRTSQMYGFKNIQLISTPEDIRKNMFLSLPQSRRLLHAGNSAAVPEGSEL